MTLPRTQITLQDYFRHELAEGKTEFRVVLNSDESGVTRIFIHPLDRDGATRDFGIVGNEASDITQWLP